jgi:hypothetical protein
MGPFRFFTLWIVTEIFPKASTDFLREMEVATSDLGGRWLHFDDRFLRLGNIRG